MLLIRFSIRLGSSLTVLSCDSAIAIHPDSLGTTLPVCTRKGQCVQPCGQL